MGQWNIGIHFEATIILSSHKHWLQSKDTIGKILNDAEIKFEPHTGSTEPASMVGKNTGVVTPIEKEVGG